MFEKILVGGDESVTARRAAAAEIAVMPTSELHVVSVSAPKAPKAPTAPTAVSQGEKFVALNTEGDVDSLWQVRSLLAKKFGIESAPHPFHGDPADALVSIADSIVDSIAVGRRGMKDVRRVLGSVPNSVVHWANFSALIVDTAE